MDRDPADFADPTLNSTTTSSSGVTSGSSSSTRTRSISVPPEQQKITEFSALTGEKKKQFDRQCLLWLTSSMRPFLVVEDPGLKEWVLMISSGRYSPPSRKTLTAMTPELFLTVENLVWT